jgi:hypothetical protein
VKKTGQDIGKRLPIAIPVAKNLHSAGLWWLLKPAASNKVLDFDKKKNL